MPAISPARRQFIYIDAFRFHSRFCRASHFYIDIFSLKRRLCQNAAMYNAYWYLLAWSSSYTRHAGYALLEYTGATRNEFDILYTLKIRTILFIWCFFITCRRLAFYTISRAISFRPQNKYHNFHITWKATRRWISSLKLRRRWFWSLWYTYLLHWNTKIPSAISLITIIIFTFSYFPVIIIPASSCCAFTPH